jgi:hypothetical protein
MFINFQEILKEISSLNSFTNKRANDKVTYQEVLENISKLSDMLDPILDNSKNFSLN